MFSTLVVFIAALIDPVQSVEEYALLDSHPLQELLTIRADYRLDGDATLRLPQTLIGEASVQLWLPGDVAAVQAVRVQDRWHFRLPEQIAGQTERSRVRVIARQLRPVETVRLFALGWPQIRWQNASQAPSRTLATVRRDWLLSATAGWSCVDDTVRDAACVSIDTRPPPLSLRVSARPSSKPSWAVTCASVLLSLGVIFRSQIARHLRVVVGAAAGLCALFVSLVLVGARWLSWSWALSLTIPSIALLIAAVAVEQRAMLVLAAGLVIVSTLGVAQGSPLWTLGCCLLTALIAAGLARRTHGLAKPPDPPIAQTAPEDAAKGAAS